MCACSLYLSFPLSLSLSHTHTHTHTHLQLVPLPPRAVHRPSQLLQLPLEERDLLLQRFRRGASLLGGSLGLWREGKRVEGVRRLREYESEKSVTCPLLPPAANPLPPLLSLT
jgi:hypothetical protein